MSIKILNKYEEDGYLVSEFTRDGETISHVIRECLEVAPAEPQPTLEEKIARMEQQIEEQSLVQLEVLATIYEELLMKG